MNCRRALVWLLLGSLVVGGPLSAAAPPPAAESTPIAASDLRTWLTYVASDELQGRATFSAGLGLAASFLQQRLAEWQLEPAGDRGSYLQTVVVQGVRTVSRSSVTVRVGQRSRTFTDGADIHFPREMGGRQTLTLDRVEFAGYGLDAPAAAHNDFAGKDLNGAALVFLGADGPQTLDAARSRRLLAGRSRYAVDQLRAAATVGPAGRRQPTRQGASGSGSPDFTTTQRLDRLIPPAVTASDRFYEFLFSGAPVPFKELRRRAAAREPLPTFRLDDVSLTFTVDADYTVVRTQLTQNVVAVVRGSDPALRNSYVGFGAHYDHVGYAEGEVSSARGAPGRVSASAPHDRIWNGADDDGSGTVALLALAKAFATGAKPRRSLLFVWHAGEERGLWGSRYFADSPTVPLDSVVAFLNIDMIGRNRDDDPRQSDTVYIVGADRISTELHEVNREANAALPRPLTLDYEMNDPADVEQIYYRSDHYSYAAKGIPVIFFTTGLHPDYHANTDDVSRIEFEKLTRITQLVYETGRRLADRDAPPHRDHLGPRAGKGTRE